MNESCDIRLTRIPLNNGSGQMPALGFGTLIPDPAATISATRAVRSGMGAEPGGVEAAVRGIPCGRNTNRSPCRYAGCLREPASGNGSTSYGSLQQNWIRMQAPRHPPSSVSRTCLRSMSCNYGVELIMRVPIGFLMAKQRRSFPPLRRPA